MMSFVMYDKPADQVLKCLISNRNVQQFHVIKNRDYFGPKLKIQFAQSCLYFQSAKIKKN